MLELDTWIDDDTYLEGIYLVGLIPEEGLGYELYFSFVIYIYEGVRRLMILHTEGNPWDMGISKCIHIISSTIDPDRDIYVLPGRYLKYAEER